MIERIFMNPIMHNFEEGTFEEYNSTTLAKLNFIRKVYLTFFASLLMATLGVFVGLTESIFLTVLQYQTMFVIVEVAVCLFAITVRRKPGINLLALALFTFLSGLTLSPIIAYYTAIGNVAIIKEALILTVVTFSGLTGYVFITKKDFSYLHGFLSMSLFGLIAVAIISIFFTMSPVVNLIYSYFGVLVFSGYILYDTSRILHQWQSDDYVGFALQLYLDFINLFLYILRILSSSDRD